MTGGNTDTGYISTTLAEGWFQCSKQSSDEEGSLLLEDGKETGIFGSRLINSYQPFPYFGPPPPNHIVFSKTKMFPEVLKRAR